MRSPREYSNRVVALIKQGAGKDMIELDRLFKEAMKDQRHVCTRIAMDSGCTEEQISAIFNAPVPRKELRIAG